MQLKATFNKYWYGEILPLVSLTLGYFMNFQTRQLPIRQSQTHLLSSNLVNWVRPVLIIVNF